jgi:23S rRNA pseudouridine1911/1915/1917 synthase
MEKEIEKIFEDENILVVSKPTGLVVNRSNTYKEVTLQDIFEKDYPDVFNNVQDEEFISRSGIVHRLDKDTSGVIIIAKNPESFYFLQKQFKDRKTYKEYIVIVHGEIKDEMVEINAPLDRNPRRPLKRAVVSSGRPAVTQVEPQNTFKKDNLLFTIAKVFPKTGRTHQIRVHMSAIGHPVVGDKIYCANNLLEKDIELFGRMMLHARILGIKNPTDEKFRRFESPLPKEFKI